MTNIFQSLSVLWTVARNTPAVLRHLPTIILLIGKIREAFASEQVKEVLKAFIDLIGKSEVQHDSVDNTKSDDEKDNQRRRFRRFRNRMDVACDLSDGEVCNYCVTKNYKQKDLG